VIANIPVLFLTALGDRETTQPAIDAGGDDLLPKPFGHAELLLRVRALIRQRRQAQQLALQHETLRQISQMIVHDLRGPTCAIMANADFLCESGLAVDEAEAAGDIAVAARHLERTIRDLLDLSMAEDVGLQARMEPVALGELANDVAIAMRGSGRSRGVNIVCDLRVERVVADRELLRRMLQNLVHNAVTHAPRDSEVTIEASADEGGVLLRVLDRGPGVPLADAERIFERYVSEGRYGLGLAFCRLVADAHGGRIWVEGRRPVGAMFCVRIPQGEAGQVTRLKRAPSCS